MRPPRKTGAMPLHCDRDMAETLVDTITSLLNNTHGCTREHKCARPTTHEIVPAIRPWGATSEQGNIPSQIGNKPPSLQGVIEAYAAAPWKAMHALAPPEPAVIPT